jgi:hypothetical protein
MQVRGELDGLAPSVAAGDARAKEAHSATYMTVMVTTSAVMAVTTGVLPFYPLYLIYPSNTCSIVSGYIINKEIKHFSRSPICYMAKI